MTPEQIITAYLDLQDADRRAVRVGLGLEVKPERSAHRGHRRTKNPIRGETRDLVMARERWSCFWCGCDLSVSGCHLDHIRLPSSPARPGEVARCVVASCPACNVGRDGVARPDIAARLDQWAASPARELDRVIAQGSEGRARSAAVRARSNSAEITASPAQELS